DGFADQDGAPIANMPVNRVRVELSEQDGRTRMEIRSSFASREDMEKFLATGTAEGMQEAVGQMDALLAG
ncbi:MAG TPA: SRPBCC domain-containing protein, partial [Acidimicrobiia bacterium]